MRSYRKPEMEIEMFRDDIITSSGPVACGKAEDELPIIPGGAEDEADFG